MSSDHIFTPKSLDNTVNTGRGTEILNELLLEQYRSSPNLLEYFGAFIEELDFLLEHTERVYLGRFLEYAQGEQLDKLGDIVGQTRAIALSPQFFGFQGASGVAGMADEATPNSGGVFQSQESVGFNVTPLDDITYRRAIRAKAYLNMALTPSLEVAYTAIIMLLGSVPRTLEIVDITDREVAINISSLDVSSPTVSLISHFAQYFITNTVVYNINLV